MTKDEMMKAVWPFNDELNYMEAQNRIMEAMSEGQKFIFLPRKRDKGWYATDATIQHLEKDGFNIDVTHYRQESWAVEWACSEK